MRSLRAFSTVAQKMFAAVLLMLGATAVIFFALRAAPGTALDAYTSLNTPLEDIAILRQELGFTVLTPLECVEGGDVAGLELLGAYEGTDEVRFRLRLFQPTHQSDKIDIEWSKNGQPSKVARGLGDGDELRLADGFSLKIKPGAVPGVFAFSAVNLDGRPLRAFYEWLAKVSVGDFGKSQTVSPSTPVMDIAAPAFLRTLILAVGALLLCMLLVDLWVIATPMRGAERSWSSWLTSVGSAPSFVVGLFVMLIVNQAGRYYWDPTIYVPPEWYPVPTVIEGEFALIPAIFAGICIVLGDGLFSDYVNTFRAEFSNVRAAPFIAAIRSKGASVSRHIFRNLIVPSVDAFAGRLPLVLGAVIIVETMFGLTGGGWYLLEAAKRRDVPLVVGLSVLFTATGIVVHLAADVVKTLTDPREADHGA